MKIESTFSPSSTSLAYESQEQNAAYDKKLEEAATVLLSVKDSAHIRLLIGNGSQHQSNFKESEGRFSNEQNKPGYLDHSVDMVALSETRKDKSGVVPPANNLLNTANASSNNTIELLHILTKYGNNPEGIPALHYAILQEDEQAIQLLLANGASPFTVDQYNPPRNCLYFAVKSKNMRLVDTFLQLGVDINQEDFEYGPLWTAIIEKQNQIAMRMMDCQKPHPHAIACCIISRNYELVEFLVKKGEKIQGQLKKEWCIGSLLTKNEFVGRISCLNLLFKKALLVPSDLKAYFQRMVSDGYCGPRSGVNSAFCPKALEYLLKNMLLLPNTYLNDVRAKVDDSYPILQIFFKSRNPIELIEILIQHGVDLNAKHCSNQTMLNALFAPTQSNHSLSDPELKKLKALGTLLIKAGINVNAKNYRNQTVLYNLPGNDSLTESQLANSINLCELLIKAGIDVNARDIFGKTVLARIQNSTLRNLLIANGAIE